MPAVSEEELVQLREKNASLRQEIADAATAQADAEAGTQRDYEATQLIAENTRLEAELAAAKAKAEAAQNRVGTEVLAANAASQLELAQRALENPTGVPVDTNTGIENEGLATPPSSSNTEDAKPSEGEDNAEGDKTGESVTQSDPTAPESQASADAAKTPEVPDLSQAATASRASTSTSKKGGN